MDNPIERSIFIAGGIERLAAYCDGQITRQRIHQWRESWTDKNFRERFKPSNAVMLERGVDKAIATDPEARERARVRGGRVQVEQFNLGQWRRDGSGNLMLVFPPARKRGAVRRRGVR